MKTFGVLGSIVVLVFVFTLTAWCGMTKGEADVFKQCVQHGSAILKTQDGEAYIQCEPIRPEFLTRS